MAVNELIGEIESGIDRDQRNHIKEALLEESVALEFITGIRVVSQARNHWFLREVLRKSKDVNYTAASLRVEWQGHSERAYARKLEKE